jgi:hypothetical protein
MITQKRYRPTSVCPNTCSSPCFRPQNQRAAEANLFYFIRANSMLRYVVDAVLRPEELANSHGRDYTLRSLP